MHPVYITGTGACLPGEPVDNERIEEILGRVHGVPSRIKRQVLRRNGIRTRYYAIDPETGRQTHDNAQLTAGAIRSACKSSGTRFEDVDALVCGTSTPDQWIPNHALMVHGELGAPPLEVVSTAGVCLCGLSALKYAVMGISCGMMRSAFVTGSELVSNMLTASHFEGGNGNAADASEPYVAFSQDFLRWMLSDGAGALLVTAEPRAGTRSLRIDWVDLVSYAGELEPCMYWGAEKTAGGSLEGWRQNGSPADALKLGKLNLSQDAKLLKEEIIHRVIDCAFGRVREKYGLSPEDVDWYLPHYSSEFFRKPTYESLERMEFPIPYEKWFTNLATKGNTGAASIFIMLDELVGSGRLKEGERILCVVPESARFSTGYMMMTVV